MAGGLRNVNAVVTITTNAVKAIEDGKKLKEVYAAINQQLNLMRAEGKTDTTEFKEMQKLAEDTKLKIDALVSGMKLIRGVVDNLANKQGRDLNRALRETAKEFNRTANDTDKHKAKLEQLRQSVSALKRELSDRKGLTMSFADAQKQLQNLANTPLDKLRAGLASVRAELEGDINSKTRAKLQGWENQYAAQIAIKETGTIPTSSLAGVQQADRTRLEAERKRLVDAYNIASQSENQQHVQWANQALQRIQALNSALKQLTEEEQKRDKAARDATSAQEKHNQAYDAFGRVIQGQKVSLKELTDAYNTLDAELKQMKGANLSPIDQGAVEGVERVMERIKQAILDIEGTDPKKVINDLNNASLDQLEAALKNLKEQASHIKVGDDNAIKQAAADMDVLEKKIAETKARLTEHVQLAEQGMNANKTLANLETASYEDLDKTLKYLEARQKKLQGTETKRMQQNIANQDKVKARMKQVKQELLSEEEIQKRVGNTGKYSVVELQKAYDQLKNKLINLRTEETEAIKETRRQMKELEKGIQDTTGKVSGLTKIWQTAVRNISTYMGVFAAFNFAKNKISEMVKKNYELSDSIMNVRKVSGLALDDINQLYSNISKIDTRNTVNTLMDLAYQGGKLGIGEYGIEGLTGFVKAAEQVQMALGEDLGEEALPAMAKLTENMGLIKDMGVEQAMQKTASAIFTLSTTSVSTGQGIVDFSKRLMPVAKGAHVATDELLGLASATESSGLAAEVASTAFVKIFPALYKNTAALEKYLGLQKDELQTLLDEDKAMDALVLVFERMNKMGNLSKHPELFKLLGSEGARMNTVMTAMANNVDMLRDHLKTSNIAFKEGTAVINEYNLQNNSAAGILERANNIWEKAFVNPEGVDMVKSLAIEWKKLSEDLTGSASWMWGAKQSLEAIAGVIGVIIKLAPILVRALMFYGIATAIRKIYIEFTMLNGAMTAATTTAGKLSAFLKSNIWVLGATAIAFAVTALVDMAAAAKKAHDEVEAAGNALENASKEGERASAKERAELKKLYETTQDVTKAMDERTKAALEMKRKYPDYFSDLTTEQILAGKAADAYANLAQQILNAAKARAMEKKIEELQTENMNLEDDNKRREQWKKDNEKRYNEEKAKNDRAVEQQNRMETSGAAGVGSKMGYVHASNAGDKQLIGEYQQNEQSIDNNTKKIDENTATMNRLSEEVSKIKPASTTIEPEIFKPGEGGDTGGGGTAKAPEWMVEEKKEAEKATKAVIGSIEEFYRLQEAAANELAANGQLKGADFEMLINHIQDRKDKMLLEARRAIVGDPNEFESIRKSLSTDIIKRDDAVSQLALQRILEAEPAKAGEKLRKYNGSDEVFGLDSNAHLNDIRKNAAQNELNIQRRQAKLVQEIDKFLMQYQFIEQAQQDFGDKLVTLGLVSDGYAKVVKQLADGTMITANTKEVQQLANKVSGMGSQLYGVDTGNASELARMTKYMMTNEEGGEESFATIFPDYKKWLEQPEQYKDKMVALYELMIQYEGIYYDQIKKRDDLQNKRLDSWWEHSDEKKQNDQATRSISLYAHQYNNFGENQGMGYMMGLTNDVSQDPEVLREQAILEAKMAIWEKAKEEREAGLISEEVYQQKLHDMQDQTMAYTEAVMKNINKRIDRVKQFVKPVETAAKSIGQKLGAMISGMEDEEATWEEIWKNMALAVAESMLEMAGQYAQNAIVKASMNKSEEAEEGAHATVMTMLGISEGAAKTIGTLGWVGIALIPVITALLMGLLNSALSTKRDSGNANSAAKTKTKLVSGMLTYDEGNVGQYVGNDGHVYTAKQQRALPEGVSIVKEPIATTVNGQPALVGEKGPEIVIGRKTSKRIMMNEPGLLRSIMQIERGGRFYTGGRGMRLFDEGNLGDVQSVAVPQQQGQQQSDRDDRVAAALEQNAAAMAAFSEVMAAIQANGIQGVFREYGAGSLDESMRKVNAFRKRYPV